MHHGLTCLLTLISSARQNPHWYQRIFHDKRNNSHLGFTLFGVFLTIAYLIHYFWVGGMERFKRSHTTGVSCCALSCVSPVLLCR